MADKNYFMTQQKFVKEQQKKTRMEQFCAQGSKILDKFTPGQSQHKRIKLIHEFYRWLTQTSERDLSLFKGRRIITLSIDRLEELTNPPPNIMRMGKVPAKKYKKILERYL